MKKLFLVDGAAGFAKNDLVRFVDSKENTTIVTKITTRKKRDYECDLKEHERNVDLKYISEEEFKKAEPDCFCYNYGEKDDGFGMARYGIPKSELDSAIEEYENTFVIVRSSECTEAIYKEYCKRIKVKQILIYADKQFTKERLYSEKREREVEARERRMNQVLDDYFCEQDFFNKVIFLSDASTEHLLIQLNKLIQEYDSEPSNMLYVSPDESYPLIKPLIGYKQDLLRQLEHHPYEKNIFLMMKYRDSICSANQNTKLYKLIKKIVEKKGFHCVRADQAEWTHLTEESSYNPLAVSYCCKYGIALIDKPEEGAAYNTNVIYELGMMATQNKKCILLRDNSVETIPFDLITTIHRTYDAENFEVEISEHLESWLNKLVDDTSTNH